MCAKQQLLPSAELQNLLEPRNKRSTKAYGWGDYRRGGERTQGSILGAEVKRWPKSGKSPAFLM